MNSKIVYPGSFDPITNGHLDIIVRASKVFEEVHVAVLNNYVKKNVFTVTERVTMIKKATNDLQNVYVHAFNGLTVNFCNTLHCSMILRGLRAVSDYENEMQMALANRELNPSIETVFFVSEGKYSFISSSMVREIAEFGGAVDALLPSYALQMVREKYKKNY